MKIKTYSGWGPWSDGHGAGITALTADVWERFVIKTKAAKPFRNNGWVYLSKMEQIMPYKPKGTHVFRPSAVASQVEPTDALNDEIQSQDWDLSQIDKDMAANSIENEHKTPEVSDDSDIEATKVSAKASAIPKTPAPAPLSLKRSSDNIFTPSTSSSKKVRGAEVLSGLVGEVSGMNQVIRDFLMPPTPSDPSLLSTPARRAKAVSLVEKESDLDDEDVLHFMHAITRDKAVADIYNSFTNPVIRRKYLDSIVSKERIGGI
ncbi:hypothetical protein BDP27DRAFT_1359379 [Rhodocollybia butyracea]|uniref:Uncharacterized protein n=1 Tax=Rhodocollybia butyracea TaxID=206335 RepID=A0A9P5PY32_9AGAR|nr:hypothetical protein BDP27DRAFT_1359379 [Rhodocollybia butyracea]